MTVHQLHRDRPAWTFGDRLRKVRRSARLTQVELATLLNVTPHSIDAWESDRNMPRDIVRMATKIEDRFGLVRGWMLGYADGPDRSPDAGQDDVSKTIWSRLATVHPIRPGMTDVTFERLPRKAAG